MTQQRTKLSERRMSVRAWHTNDLAEHVALMRRQVERSLDDPHVRQLAAKIVNGKVDRWIDDPNHGRVPVVIAWDEQFVQPATRCQMRDDLCESKAIWNFVVANVRYMYDPSHFDLFCTAEYTLKAGGGDCDDMTILFAALHHAVGFEQVAARVVTTTGDTWEHVYALVGVPKDARSAAQARWYGLDPTVPGATYGWQYERVLEFRDFYI